MLQTKGIHILVPKRWKCLLSTAHSTSKKRREQGVVPVVCTCPTFFEGSPLVCHFLYVHSDDYVHLSGRLRFYGVVPKGLLTFLGTLYREVAKTTSGTLVYCFERQTARKNISSFEKHCVLDLGCRILSQEPSDSCFLYFNVTFHGK